MAELTPEERISIMGNLRIIAAVEGATPEQEATALSMMGNISAVTAGAPEPPPPEGTTAAAPAKNTPSRKA